MSTSRQVNDVLTTRKIKEEKRSRIADRGIADDDRDSINYLIPVSLV